MRLSKAHSNHARVLRPGRLRCWSSRAVEFFLFLLNRAAPPPPRCRGTPSLIGPTANFRTARKSEANGAPRRARPTSARLADGFSNRRREQVRGEHHEDEDRDVELVLLDKYVHVMAPVAGGRSVAIRRDHSKEQGARSMPKASQHTTERPPHPSPGPSTASLSSALQFKGRERAHGSSAHGFDRAGSGTHDSRHARVPKGRCEATVTTTQTTTTTHHLWVTLRLSFYRLADVVAVHHHRRRHLVVVFDQQFL